MKWLVLIIVTANGHWAGHTSAYEADLATLEDCQHRAELVARTHPMPFEELACVPYDANGIRGFHVDSEGRLR
jgi:hypothetical protein